MLRIRFDDHVIETDVLATIAQVENLRKILRQQDCLRTEGSFPAEFRTKLNGLGKIGKNTVKIRFSRSVDSRIGGGGTRVDTGLEPGHGSQGFTHEFLG